MKSDDIAVGKGYEKGLEARGPFGWYMRWYLRRRRPIEVPTVLQAVGGGTHPRVLDAGCGTGLWLADVYRRGHGHESLAGVEVSAMMAQETRDRLAALVAPDTEVQVEDCSAVELPSDVLMQRLEEAGFIDTAPYKVKRPWRMPVTLEGAVATRE